MESAHSFMWILLGVFLKVYGTHTGVRMLLEGISSVSLRLTAPSAEGAFWCVPPRKASPERGGARDMRAEGFVPPTSHGRGGSVSRRDLNQPAGTRAQLSGGSNPEETYPAKRQPLFGREREGGAS